MTLRHLTLATMAATAALALLHLPAQAAGNFAFAVPAPNGLRLVISGYDTSGGELFRDTVTAPESYNGASHYITRVDETILFENTLAKWCVADESGQWTELPEGDAKATLCDDQPSETRGTYGFVARAIVAGAPDEPATPEEVLLTGRDAVVCVQTELNGLGFDAGVVDGQLGRGTKAALVQFTERQLSTYDLPAIDKDTAGLWCAELRKAVAAGTAVVPGSGSLDLIFGSDIDEAARAETSAALSDIETFYSEMLGYSLKERPAVYVSSDPKWMTDAYLKQRRFGEQYRKGKMEDFGRCNGGEAGHGYIFMCAKSNVFSGDWFELGSAAQRKFALTHEYFHMIEYELAGERSWSCCSNNDDSVKLIGPTWLVEGVAEYLAFVILREDGWAGFSRQIADHTGTARERGNLPSDLVSRDDFYADQWASSSGMIGAHLIAEDVGFPAFIPFWAGLGAGKKWPAAFEAAFGLTPDAFDERFAKHVGL